MLALPLFVLDRQALLGGHCSKLVLKGSGGVSIRGRRILQEFLPTGKRHGTLIIMVSNERHSELYVQDE